MRRSPNLLIRSAALALACLAICKGAETHSVFRSTDRGKTWTRADVGLSGCRVNAFTHWDGVLFAGTDLGVFASTDRGKTWRHAPGALSSVRVLSLAFAGASVFAGTDGNGLFVSSDKGTTWARVPMLPARKVRCLDADSLAGKVYAGTDTDGVFSTDDKGKSWTPMPSGLPKGAQVFALAVVDSKLFAGLYSKGLYEWDESKRRWTKIGTVSPLVLAASGKTLLAGHNPGGLHWSADLGETWSRAKGSPLDASGPGSGRLAEDAPVWALNSGEGLSIAGAADAIFLSEDGGQMWLRARGGLPSECPGVAFLVTEQLILASAVLKEAEGLRFPVRQNRSSP